MSPNPIAVFWSIFRALRVRRPNPPAHGGPPVDHSRLASTLEMLAARGIGHIDGSDLLAYRDALAQFDPNRLDRSESLAFWLNLYNAGALELAARAAATAQSTVLRVPGAFDSVWATVGGEQLSLNDIEHGKIRRFGDPRVHAALVCGSASCPTLRLTPYSGIGLEAELDDQMRSFLSNGGAVIEGDRVMLSRVFLWYGADFVRPKRMPAFIPTSKKRVAAALDVWAAKPLAGLSVEYQPYDWALSCSIG